MEIIKSSFQEFWEYLSGSIPEPIITALIAVSLMCLFYCLFLRWLVSLTKNTKIIHMIDLFFSVIVICTIAIICLPHMPININKILTEVQYG